MTGHAPVLRVRWLGRVAYRDGLALQRGLFARSRDDHLLLVEHEPVYTLGVRADLANLLVPAATVGAELVKADRGGDITYHGPGQITGYPILSIPGKRGGGMADTVAYVRSAEHVDEQLLDRPHVSDRVGHPPAPLSGHGEDRVADELARAVVGDVPASVGADELGADRVRVDQEVVEGPASPQGEDVGVLQQEQVVVRGAGEQAVLQGVGVGIRHPPQPPQAQHYSSVSQSRVSMMSFSRARKAAA